MRHSAATSAVRSLPIAKLLRDQGTQLRHHLQPDVIQDYAERMQAGDEFPPVDVFHEGESYWLANGFHRVAAVEQLGKKSIRATVHNGGLRDAILFACKANAKHGLQRSDLDKRAAVDALLSDPEWVKKSNRWIAQVCVVSHTFVANMRAEQAELTGNVASGERECRDGRTIIVTSIGRKPEPQFVEVEYEQADEPEAISFVDAQLEQATKSLLPASPDSRVEWLQSALHQIAQEWPEDEYGRLAAELREVANAIDRKRLCWPDSSRN